MILKLVVQRLGHGLVIMFAISIVVFAGTEVLPGDVAEAVLGQDAAPDTVAALRLQLGLDRPAPVRYLEWVRGMFTGDLGQSLATQREISEIIALRLPMTLLLAGITAAVAVPLALVLGLLAAMHPGTLFDRGIAVGTLCLISGPEFLIATLLVMLFAVSLGWTPAIAYISDGASATQLARALALPVMTLTFALVGPMTRMTRSAVLNVLTSPAIETAILKGASRARIILLHALPNALSPIFNVIAINLAYLVSGVLVVEVIFAYPGMAKLMVDSVSFRDVPMVQACAMIFCGVYVVLILLADVLSLTANPRLRHPR